jgi:hypothetical protein
MDRLPMEGLHTMGCSMVPQGGGVAPLASVCCNPLQGVPCTPVITLHMTQGADLHVTLRYR